MLIGVAEEGGCLAEGEEAGTARFPAEREIEYWNFAPRYSWVSYTLFDLIPEHDDHLRTCIVYSPCRNAVARYTPSCVPCPRLPGFLPASLRLRQWQPPLRHRSPPPPQRPARFLRLRLLRRSWRRPGLAWTRRPAQARIACTDNHRREIAQNFCLSQAEPLRSDLKGCLRMKPAVIQRVKQARFVFLTCCIFCSLRGCRGAGCEAMCLRPPGQLCVEG
jgi:hypothetical protein